MDVMFESATDEEFVNTPPEIPHPSEGLCSACAHGKICVYKDRYCAAQAAVNKLLLEADWAKPMVVGCKHFMEGPKVLR